MPTGARLCPRPTCPNLQPCPDHKRPGAKARGYDTQHQRRRARALAHLKRHPGLPCPWCSKPMTVDMALDWDHTKRGLTHASCNRSDGGRRAHE